MVNRYHTRSGRGYDRDGGRNYYQKIVQEKEKQINRKTEENSEDWKWSEKVKANKPGRKRDSEKSLQKERIVSSTMRNKTEDEQMREAVRNAREHKYNWFSTENEETETMDTNGDYEANVEINSTESTDDMDEDDISSEDTEINENIETRKQKYLKSNEGKNKNSDIIMNKMTQREKIDYGSDEDMVTAESRQKEMEKITSVKVKKELVEEEAETLWGEEEQMEVYSVDSEDFSDAILEESKGLVGEKGSPPLTSPSQRRKDLGISKRKSTHVGQVQNHKRLQKPGDITPQRTKEKVGDNKVVHPESVLDTNDDEPREEILLDETEVQNKTNTGTVLASAKSSTEKIPTIRRSNSDLEWEKIANDIAELEAKQNSKASTSKPDETKTNDEKKQKKKRQQIKLDFSNKTTDTSIMRERGLQMLEEKSKFITPVRIEFNVANTRCEFNMIQAVETLFKKFADVDNSLRIYHTDKKTFLWDVNTELPLNKEFIKSFQLREQTFCKGNKKATIYCIMESHYTVNRIKYTELVNSHILETNTWIKPDYYATKTISSPGFFTLLHPRLTNRQEFEKDLKRLLSQTDIDGEDEVVKAWKVQKILPEVGYQPKVPKFHLETSTRKWGGIQVEVMSLHCDSDDAKYFKYLMAAADEQDKIVKGLFIPTGIHLIEGRDLMINVLEEQRVFLDTVTSFQLSGISYEEMRQVTESNDSTYKLLLRCDGVVAVEPTYQTMTRGTWLVVVESNKVNVLSEYIKTHMRQIYNNRSQHIRLKW